MNSEKRFSRIGNPIIGRTDGEQPNSGLRVKDNNNKSVYTARRDFRVTTDGFVGLMSHKSEQSSANLTGDVRVFQTAARHQSGFPARRCISRRRDNCCSPGKLTSGADPAARLLFEAKLSLPICVVFLTFAIAAVSLIQIQPNQLIRVADAMAASNGNSAPAAGSPAKLNPKSLNEQLLQQQQQQTTQASMGSFPQASSREIEKQIVDKILGEGYDKRIRPAGSGNASKPGE